MEARGVDQRNDAELLERLAWGDEPLGVLRELARGCAALSAGSGCLVLAPDDRGALRALFSEGVAAEWAAALEGRPASGDSPHGLAVLLGAPVLVADARGDERFPTCRERAARTGVLSVWAFPLADRHGVPLGVLALHPRAAGPPSDADVAALAGRLALLGCAVAAWRRSRATGDLAARYALVVQATHHVLYERELASDTVTWSERMAEVFGHGPGPSRDRYAWWVERIHPDDRERVVESLTTALAGKGPEWSAEYRFQRGDGANAWVQDRAVIQRDDAARPLRVVGVLQDITTQHELQGRLAMAERFASVGTLAAGVAHEINNPLAWISANVNFAVEELSRARVQPSQAGEAIDETLAALEDVRSGADRVGFIVRNLKTFARAEDDRVGPVDVRRPLESALTIAGNDLRHRAQVVKELGPVPTVDGNESRLGQVFLNLLLNAVHALGARPQAKNVVRVVTRTDDVGRAVIEVSDTGSGISDEVLPRIFDPFFTTRPVGRGTGLGLSVCHSIITGLGGTIEVETKVGVGSTFRVLLPARQKAVAEQRQAPPPPGSGRRGRIVVIDDEAAVLTVFERVLGPAHDVVTFTDATAAVADMRAHPPDLVFCDVMMPEVSGPELYVRLLEQAPELTPRVIFMTGGAFTDATRDFLERVKPPILEKPFSTDALRQLAARQTPRPP